MPAPLLGESLSRRFTLHLTPGLMKLIDDVARRDCTTPSAWARAVLLAALKKEGVKLQVPLVSHCQHWHETA